MKRLKLAFSDQIQPFPGEKCIWTQLLREYYEVEVVSNIVEADLLIYSDFGNEHRQFPGRKIYITNENMPPDYNECDFAITLLLRPDDPRHFRFPYYAFFGGNKEALIKPADFDAQSVLRSKTGFCCFVVSNARALERNRFFRTLHRRKHVDSGGRAFNTIGEKVSDKIAFTSKYKFAIAFENSMAPGYTTEKIVDAMKAMTIPIYWGDPDIGREFNLRSFINASDFSSFDALADHILRVDADDSLYLNYLREPWFPGNLLPDTFRLDLLREALVRFIESGDGPRPRVYRKRRLREHTFTSPVHQSIVSLRCRLESKLWDLGIRF